MSDINVTETEAIETIETEVPEIETDELTEIIREILAEIKDDEMTAYGAWKVYVATGTAIGLNKINPSQYIYNFARNGMIVKGRKGSVGGIKFNKEEIGEWCYRYVTGQATKWGTSK